MTDHLKGVYSSEDPDWRTPGPLFWRLHTEFCFNIDLAEMPSTISYPCTWALVRPCSRRPSSSDIGPGLHEANTTRATVSLRSCAPTRAASLNPPYSRKRKLPIEPWMARCLRTQEHGGLVVGIVPARTDTPWWHHYVMASREVRLVRGRIHFDPSSAYKAAHPDKRSSGNFPSAVVIWDGRGSRTARAPYLCSRDWR